VSRYQKGKTNVDFTEARDSEWQWHQLGHMQVCTSHPSASSCFLYHLSPFATVHGILFIKSSKPIQIGLCMVMSLSIHLSYK